jgi:mRNA interferase MazF
MEKDFDTWNVYKKQIHKQERLVNFHEREIWWSSFGLNIGSEQDGRGDTFERPVLILKKLSKRTSIILPLSTKQKIEKFQSPIVHESIEGYALLDQIKVIDQKRLIRKVGTLDKEQFTLTVCKLKALF